MRQLVILAVGARQLLFQALGARQPVISTIDAPAGDSNN
jgi:hypothetical protein